MNRVALYSDKPGAGVLICGRDAREHGDRIVVAACEGDDRRQGRQVLYGLVERMLSGEFDAIIASVASDAHAVDASRLTRLSHSGAAR